MDRPHLRSVGISDFVRWHSENSLILSPKFQRRRVWPRKARAYLIDTILRGMPIPKLYMRQHLDVEGARTIHEVVDGQQRLAAVLEFYQSNLKLSSDHEHYPKATYSTLAKDEQRTFLGYEFSVDLLTDATDAEVLDVFARINSYSVPLNAQEKRNAKYFGVFKTTVYALGWDHLEFWKTHRVLSDTAIARMREAELTSELIVAMLDGLQDKKKALDGYYKRWDDRFPRRGLVVRRFRDVIDLIVEIFGDTLSRTKFRRPALFYSLFLAVYEMRYGALGARRRGRKVLSEPVREQMRQGLLMLDDVLEQEELPRGYLRFVTACQRQTDNLHPRKIRHRMLLSTFLS